MSGNSTAVRRFPPSFVAAGTPLRFIADPIGQPRLAVSDQSWCRRVTRSS
jgi:hypothetical protein